MKKEFRSRGIRLMKNIDYTDLINFPQCKIYYNADKSLLNNMKLKNYVDKGLLEYFEYSKLENGKIDTFNFHNNLNKISTDLYENLSEIEFKKIKEIPLIFDKNFLNYTIGYRVKNQKILNYNYYFYPTIKKETGFGIKGITDRSKIIKYTNNFINYIKINNLETEHEVSNFFSLMYKFKGISISFSDDNQFEYKIYGKITTNSIYKFLKNKILIDTCIFKQYGEVVLVSQRIRNNEILGYNLYYLS